MMRKVLKSASAHPRIERFKHKYAFSGPQLSTSRRNVSRAVAIGLFFAFMPMPFQMAAVVMLMALIRFNVPLALMLVWFSNPLTMPFIFYVEYLTGVKLLMRHEAVQPQMSLEWFQMHFDAILLPLYAGALFYGMLIALLSYYLVHWMWIRSVKKEKVLRDAKR